MIAEQEARVADLRKKVELEEAVLRGMRLMADSSPSPPRLQGVLSSNPSPIFAEAAANVLRRGRQPGAISHQWRDTLGSLYERFPVPFSSNEVLVAAHANGLMKVRLREAEDRIRAYVDFGYLERAGAGFKVSDLAVQKYGFSRRQTVEAPTTDAEGAS